MNSNLFIIFYIQIDIISLKADYRYLKSVSSAEISVYFEFKLSLIYPAIRGEIWGKILEI